MRFDTIDGIRGHLLLGMMVAHLAFSSGTQESLHHLLNLHHFRLIGMYDAEFFVPISGFMMGFLFRNKWHSDNHKLRQFLWVRTVKVYKYQMLCALPVLLLIGFNGGIVEWFHSALAKLGAIVVLQAGFSYADILPIYLSCFVILTIPCMLGWTSRVIPFAVYCLSIYLMGQLLWFHNLRFIAFDVLSWSLLFNIFFVAGMYRQEIIQLCNRITLSVRLILVVLFSMIWISIWQLELYPEVLTHLPRKPNSSWARTQLNPAYLLMILSFVTVFVLILTYRGKNPLLTWPQKAMTFYFNLPFLKHIGRQSLKMFVAHVFIINGYILLLKHTQMPLQLPAAYVSIVLFLCFAYRHSIYNSMPILQSRSA